MNNTKSISKLLPVLTAFFVMGFCDIVGITSDYMQHSFEWSSTMTGLVPSFVFIWFLFLAIPCGNLMNRIGRKNTVMVSLTITVVGMFLPLVSYDSVTCLLAYMLLGIGNAVLQVSLNPLLQNVVTNQKLMASSLTAGQVIKAISSLLGPEFVVLATTHFGNDHWYYCFPILGCFTIVSAIWLALTPITRETGGSQHSSVTGSLSLLKRRTVLLLFFGIFFIVGIDVGTNFISSKIMASRFAWEPEEVKFAPQIYFLCRTVGAMLGVVLLAKVKASQYFKLNIIATVLSILLLAFVSHPTFDMVCIGCIGFFASSIFPIIYSMAFDECPDRINEISGLMITAIAGGAVVPPVIGYAIDKGGITMAILVIALCALYLTYCAFGIQITCKRA